MSDFSIHWFRKDLRLEDNPSFHFAASEGRTVLPIYIHDTVNNQDNPEFQEGEATRWWLHHSLNELNQNMDHQLRFFYGNPLQIIQELIEQYSIQSISWNRCYEPWEIERDTEIKSYLNQHNIEVKTFNSSLLFEPWEVLKEDQTPYKVFTPFYKKGCLGRHPGPRQLVAKPKAIQWANLQSLGTNLESLDLLPSHPWHEKLHHYWTPGEKSGKIILQEFLNEGLDGYKDGRNFPSLKNVSRLSPYLHFGEVSPHQIWFADKSGNPQRDIDHFLSEIGWREFSYYLIFHFPSMCTENLNGKFDNFPWEENPEFLKAWKEGKTGYPIVDAGMRELWETGYMHNRVRMIVASFLVKNLLIHWKEGLDWFRDCLCDADLQNNTASWQWTAGSGADAAPYFRIFNPILQARKFDPDGTYIKRFVPELASLPAEFLFAPWETSPAILEEYGIELGKNYPKPLVSIEESRDYALKAYDKIKG